MVQAKDCKCRECDKQAVAFFPVFDPDIPSYPYCRKCLDKLKMEILIGIEKIDKEYEKSKSKS